MTVLSPGDRLDRYELLCVLAQGGMGTVWLARLTGKHGFERLVAVKTILATHDGDRHFSDMFLDEGRIASQIDHENVARILEIGEDRGVIYHAMELIDGESLRKLYRDVRAVDSPFPLAVALRIIADVCAGLHAVHELRGSDGAPLEVVHRDVSPQNILVTVRGTVKLIDFGVAKARERRTEDTTAGTLKGKIEYMAPEQARSEPIDRRADVYAVGAVLYELLAGKPVRRTEDGRQLLALHELMTGVPYEPLRDSVPLPVRVLVDRALARDPLLRFPTADDMRHALEQVMVSLGHVATSDDVANVLSHFSHERTQRRKDAIEAAARAAQALERERSLSGHVSRTGPPSRYPAVADPMSGSVPSRSGADHGVVGAHGTRVIGTSAVSVAEGPSTRPSMRTMQGASMSDGPLAAQAGLSPTKIFGAAIVLSLVAVLGVVGGVLVSRTGVVPVAGSNAPVVPPPTATVTAAPTATPAKPTVAVTAAPTAALTTEPSEQPALVDPSASAEARPTSEGAVTAATVAPAVTATATVKGGGVRKGGGGGGVKPQPRPPNPPTPKSANDEYGF